MDACDQKRYNDLIIYYTGHAYIRGGLKGSWVCRDGQGIHLKDVTDIFKNLLEKDLFSLTIISDCCYSGQWIKDVNKIGIQPKNLTIISACNDNEEAKSQVLIKALLNTKDNFD